MSEEAKYTRVEYERRFLVSPQADWRGLVEPYFKKFEDKYLHGSRLRLRILMDSDTGRAAPQAEQEVRLTLAVLPDDQPDSVVAGGAQDLRRP